MDIVIRLPDAVADALETVVSNAGHGIALSDPQRTVLREFGTLLRMCRRHGAQWPLTKRQHEILAYITGYIDAHGYAPLYREIAQHFGYRADSTAHEQVAHLVRKGYLEHTSNESRSLRVITPERNVLEAV